jgi:hypothetical protein
MDKLSAFKKFNESHRKTLVFHLGVDAGFFSEINNLVLSLFYCLNNGIRFTLFDRDAWFGIEGWEEFFEPFCRKVKTPVHRKINTRMGQPVDKFHRYVTRKIYKFFHPRVYLTHELWNGFRDTELTQQQFSLPELGIRGSLREGCREIIKMIWRYNPETRASVTNLARQLGLTEKYIGFHIRGGDKFREDQLHPVADYFNKAIQLSACRTAFVLTDDYRMIESIREQYPEWRIYTLCRPEEQGYYHQEFMKRDKSWIRQQTLRLLASTDILAGAEYFIGTFSSNPGMFMGMRMNLDKCIDVDGREWLIW